MKYLIATANGQKYIKLHTKQITVFTVDKKLAMEFKSKNEADRFGMTVLCGDYQVVKVDKQ